MEEEQIYLEASYSYRKLKVLLTGLGLSSVLLALFVWAIIPQFLGFFPQEDFGIVEFLVVLLFLMLIPGLLLFSGIYFVYAWFVQRSLEIKITQQGIHYGKKFYSWDKVSALWLSTQSNKTSVFFNSRRFISTTVILEADEILEAVQLEHFAQQIQEKVQPKHPHLRFSLSSQEKGEKS